MQSKTDSLDPSIHDQNGAKIFHKTLKISAGVKIYTALIAQTTEFHNFNAKSVQGKPS